MVRLATVVCSLSFFLQAQTIPTAPKTSPQISPKSTRAGEILLPGQATRIKQPLGYSVAPESTHENFLQFFQENYVRLRAYPGKTINPELRVRAYERLQLQRQELRLRHIGPGWLQRPRVGHVGPEGPGTPGSTGPGGCAWSSLGPTNVNGRVTGIGIDPTNSQRLFVTSVGGIWRSIDGGRRWQRVSEDFLATVFASVAVNPANAVEIFAGAGDPNYGGLGAHTATGVWRSGANGDPGSWTKISGNTLDGAVIYKLFVDPSAPNNIYAATSTGVYLGTRNGPNFAWTRIANFDAWTSDLAVDFSVNPRRVYAGVQSASVNFAKGVWKYDGNSWQKRDSGIPTANSAVIALALAANTPATLYAKVENGINGRLQGVYKTTTAGEPPMGGGNAWANLPNAMVMDDSIFLGGSGYSWYNSVLAVHPTDANTVYGGGLGIYRTTNGGTNWVNVSGGADASYPQYVHSDHHAVAFNVNNPNIVYVGDDGGIFRSSDTSQTTWHWEDISHGMVMTEFYHTTSQQLTASLIAGGSQDNGTEITFGTRTWYQPGGCDGSDVAVDAKNGDTLYSNCNGGLYELANPVPGTPGGGSQIAWALPANTAPAAPVITDGGVARAALMAGVVTNGMVKNQVLLKTTDGVNWAAASQQLSTGSTISFIATAPSSNFQAYYVGVVGGGTVTIWTTTNGGAMWNTNAQGLPNLVPTAAVVDYTNANRAIAVFGGTGGAYMTTDGGAHWNSLAGSGMSALPQIWLTGVVIDPADANTVYVSTGIGVFKGVITPGNPPTAAWTPFDEGLADGLDINGISINQAGGFLTVGTMGHGTYWRDVRPGTMCSATMLLVRDNVFDRGLTPSASGVPDAEHPIPDVAHPNFYKPNDTPAGEVYWWTSADIRIDVPDADPPANTIANADSVEVSSCPIEVSPCPSGTVLDSNPERGHSAKAYVQVANRGIQPASNVRVIALWADATTGLPLLPNDFWTTTFAANSNNCGPLNGASPWHLVNPGQPCQIIPVVNPEYPETAEFDWTVPLAAADHSCMLTIIESADDPIDPNVRASNEVRPWILVPNNRQVGLRNLHIISAASPMQRIHVLVTLRIPNPLRERIPLDLVISNPAVNRGTTIHLMLPRTEQLRMENVRPSAVQLDAQQRTMALRHKFNAKRALQVTAQHGVVHGLSVEPGETITAALVLDSGPKVLPGTATRVTILARYGDTVLGGSTYILRIPAKPRATRVAAFNPKSKITK
jgi:hypothetical protein